MMATFHKWLVLIACCFVNANPFAIALTLGTLYLPLMEKFKEDRAKTATVQSLLIGITMSTAIIWGILCRKFGLWKVILVGSVLTPAGYIASFFATSLYQVTFCIGILSGFGTSIGYVCSSVAVARIFKGKGSERAIVALNCSVGIGTVAYPFLMDFLLMEYGISGTFLLLGGVNLNNLVVSLIHYIYPYAKVESEHNQTTEIAIASTQNLNKFFVLTVSVMRHFRNIFSRIMTFRVGSIIIITGISVGCFLSFLVVALDIFASKGISDQQGLNSFKVLHACSIIGRLLPMLLHFKKDLHPMTILILCSAFGCAGQLMILLTSAIPLMFIGSGLCGISLGGLISGGTVALVHLAKRDSFGVAFGLMITVIGVLVSGVGPLYGWIRDELQSYVIVNTFQASIHGLAAILCLISLFVAKTVADERAERTEVEVGEL